MTFSEQAHPPELNNLLAFPRYFSKNYGDLDAGTSAKELLKLAWYCLNPRIALRLIPIAPKLLAHIAKYGMPEYLLFALFDLVNATLFVHYHQREKPDFSGTPKKRSGSHDLNSVLPDSVNSPMRTLSIH